MTPPAPAAGLDAEIGAILELAKTHPVVRSVTVQTMTFTGGSGEWGIDNAGLNTVMSNSFGFGGTNASLVLERVRAVDLGAVEARDVLARLGATHVIAEHPAPLRFAEGMRPRYRLEEFTSEPLAPGAFALSCTTSTGIALVHASSGASFTIDTGTVLGYDIGTEAERIKQVARGGEVEPVEFLVGGEGVGHRREALRPRAAGVRTPHRA